MRLRRGIFSQTGIGYFAGNKIFEHSESTTYQITIETPSLSVSTDKTTFETGETLVAYGYGNSGDTVKVTLTSQQGQTILSKNTLVAQDGTYFVVLGVLPDTLLKGTYTLTASSASFGITDSITINIEPKAVFESVDIVAHVFFDDQGRTVPLEGIKAVLEIGSSTKIEFADASGNFEFKGIQYDSRLQYLLHFEMTDGISFNLVDSVQFDPNTSPYVITPTPIESKVLALNIDPSQSQNKFSIDLGNTLPYDSIESHYINLAFEMQTKIVKFYNRVLNERPPLINLHLFSDGGSWYMPTNYDPVTGKVESGYRQTRIAISFDAYNLWSAIGMEYTHYAQDYAFKKTYGFDTSPSSGNHVGFNGESTVDSWIEGVGGFMPAVIADWYNRPEAGTFLFVDLESNKYKPDSEIFKWPPPSQYWLDEEFALSSLLWDMYDKTQDGENTSLSINQVWSLIIAFENFETYHSQYDYWKKWSYNEKLPYDSRHIKYFKDLYEFSSDYDINRDGRVDSADQKLVDDVFALHGIPNGYTDPARPDRV